MNRVDLRGTAILVVLANWSGEAWAVVLDKIAEALRLGAVEDLKNDRVVAKHLTALGLKNAVAALIAGTPLIESLTKRRVGVRILTRLASVARTFLERLIESRGDQGKRSLRLADEPSLEEALRRPLAHRFIMPLWARTGRSDLTDTGISGWGTWHPVVETPDDLLTWALANAMESNTIANVGVCVDCENFYFSDRRGRHRFCSSACRDRHWNRKTGAERTRKSRGQIAGQGAKAPRKPNTTFMGVGAASHVPLGVRK